MTKLYKAKIWMIVEAESLKQLKKDFQGDQKPFDESSITEIKSVDDIPEGLSPESYAYTYTGWGDLEASGLTIEEWLEENSPERRRKAKAEELKELEKEIAKVRKELASLK
jgi:hypothetical protein